MPFYDDDDCRVGIAEILRDLDDDEIRPIGLINRELGFDFGDPMNSIMDQLIRPEAYNDNGTPKASRTPKAKSDAEMILDIIRRRTPAQVVTRKLPVGSEEWAGITNEVGWLLECVEEAIYDDDAEAVRTALLDLQTGFGDIMTDLLGRDILKR